MSATMAVSRDQSDVRSNAPQLPEFHQASTKSRTANVQASLYFLDYLRLKKADEARQRASAPTSAEAAARILEQLALIRAEHFTTKPEDPPSPGRDSTS